MIFLNADLEAQLKAKDLCFELNQLRPSDPKRNQIIKELIPNIGKGSYIVSPFYCDYGTNIEIGENLYANYGLIILDEAKVCIGNNVLIAPNVLICTVSHPLSASERNTQYGEVKPIRIGNNVWIGANSIILQGVEIEDNAVIAAGSVVKNNVPMNTIVAGNPARIVKRI